MKIHGSHGLPSGYQNVHMPKTYLKAEAYAADQTWLHCLTGIERIYGKLLVVYAKVEFMLVYLLLNLQNFCFSK